MEPIIPSEEIIRRFSSHDVDTEQSNKMDTIRSAGADFAALIEAFTPEGRERAAAVLKVEESVFHACAGVERPPSPHGRPLTMERPK